MHKTRGPRVIRGAAAASVATLAALLMHVTAGGAMPHALGLLAAWGVTVVVATALAGRRLSLLRLAITVTLSQLVFHALFVFGAVGAAGLSTDPHAYHGRFLLPALPEGTAVALQADLAMWLSHGVAAVLTIAFIHRGEHAARRLLALAGELAAWTQRALARPAVTVAAPQPRPRGLTPSSAGFRVITAAFTVSLRRRGPPLFPAI